MALGRGSGQWNVRRRAANKEKEQLQSLLSGSGSYKQENRCDWIPKKEEVGDVATSKQAERVVWYGEREYWGRENRRQ